MLKKLKDPTRGQKVQKRYNELLSTLKPVAKMKLDGASLVVRYSHDFPNLMITPDAQGNVYIVNCLEAINKKKPEPPLVNEIEPKTSAHAHDFPIFDVDWHDNSTKYITGAADPACCIWDVETGKCLFRGYTHKRSVRSVKSCKKNPSNEYNLFVSGGRDGQLLVWDTRTADAPSDANSDDNYVPLINGHLVDKGKEELESFTGVSFYNDDQTILSTQSNSTMIKVWDLRLMSQATPKKKKSDKSTNPYLMLRIDKSLALQNRITYITDKIINFREKVTKKKEDLVELWELHEELSKMNTDSLLKEDNVRGLSSIFLSRKEDRLLVSQIDHSLHLYEVDSLERVPPKIFRGHKSSLYVRSIMSPCNNYVASGSADQGLHIWSVDKPEESMIQLYGGHYGEVNCVDWSPINYNFLASVGDDEYLVIWDYDTNE